MAQAKREDVHRRTADMAVQDKVLKYNELDMKRLRKAFAAVRAKDRPDAVIDIGEASFGMLSKLDAAVHRGRLEEHILMKEVHAVRLEAGILDLRKAVTEKA